MCELNEQKCLFLLVRILYLDWKLLHVLWYFSVAGHRSELLTGNTVILKEKIDDTNQIFENGTSSCCM